MKITILARVAMLILATVMLSGCLMVPVDDRHRDRSYKGHDRGGHHGDRHDRGGRYP